MTASEAERSFSFALLLSATRCIVGYGILPIALPLLSLAPGIEPWIDIPIGLGRTLDAPFSDRSPITLPFLPRTVHLVGWRGDDFGFRLIVIQDEDPADLTGARVDAHIRITPDGDLEGEFGTAITGNVVYLLLSHDVSEILPLSTVWDCQIILGSGWVSTVAAGSIQLSPDVTRLP